MRQAVTRIGFALLLGIALVFAALAETNPTEDAERWSRMAANTERILDGDAPSTAALESLRERLVEFRREFDTARGVNATRIATLREQLAALGPAPEGDAAGAEATDVAATRAEINDQLSALLVPVQRAEAQYVRADALVAQIDKTLRDAQAEELLNTVSSPLNPATWKPAVGDFMTSLTLVWGTGPGKTSEVFWERLPITLLLGALGLLLIFRGRHWSHMIAASLRQVGLRGMGIWQFLASLFRIFLPFAGLMLLALAANSSHYFSPRLAEMFILLAFFGGIMLGMRWIAERVFARDEDDALLLLPASQRAESRIYVGTITGLIVVREVILQVLGDGADTQVSKSVLTFPVTLIVSLALFRMGRVLRSYSDPKPNDDIGTELRSSSLVRVVRGIGTGAVIVAVLAPLLGALGYFRAQGALLPPFIMTMAILGLIMVLQRFAADIYGVVTGQGAQAREALMPVLFGFILLLFAAPVLALIWGVRQTDLIEIWGGFMRGFAVGDTRISPTDFVAFAVIFAIGFILTRLLQSALKNNVLPKTKVDVGGQNAIVSGVGYIGIFLAALIAITGAGIDLSSIALVAGALSVGIGFGLQNIVSNFVSGIILLIERPISEGDWIQVGTDMGYVRDISVRSTRIETFDKTDVIVPNADLVSGTVTNYTRGNTVGRVIVPIGVAYGTDTKKVEAILREIAEAQPMVLAMPAPSVLFLNFGADALEFEVRCFLRDVNWMMGVKSAMNHEIAARFAAEGIEIPFAQRDVWLRNPEVLHPDYAKTPEPNDKDAPV